MPLPKLRDMLRWTLLLQVTLIQAQAPGKVTCEEYAAALIKRARHYKDMNQFMNWDNDPDWPERVKAAARQLDGKARLEGVEAIAPLYGLPLPMKGTMATTDFISSAGVGILHDLRARANADFVEIVLSKHGIVFGKTNVPELAASLVTCNYADGCTLNPYDNQLTSGGSSGGAGSAVASYLAPVAVTEDTGGSTRSPAFSNGNFGFDPTRGHFPNAGNPGMSLILDQLGLNARSIEDILVVDAALSDYDPAKIQAKRIEDMRIGVPRYPFVEAYVPAGGDNAFGYAQAPTAFMPSKPIMAKYEAAKEALARAGATLVAEEWPSEGGQNVLGKAFFQMKMGKEVVSAQGHVMATYMGQVAQWMHDYLGASATISDVIADTQSAGAGHSPSRFMNMASECSEAKLNFIIQELRAAGVEAWNRLFDQENLDAILIPGLLHTPTYECMAASSCEHQVKNMTSGEVETRAEFTSLDAIFMHTYSMKHIPLPKMMVPVGLDSEGRPVGLQLLGRAGPPGSRGMSYSYDYELLKVVDGPFLKTVQVVVDAMIAADPSLARQEPALVRGPGNLFE